MEKYIYGKREPENQKEQNQEEEEEEKQQQQELCASLFLHFLLNPL